MAGNVNMKAFYVGLGLIAVAGGAAIWMAASRGGSGTEILEAPVPVGTATFPGYVIGADSAPVEIVEYADFRCPACAAFSILQEPDIKQRLVVTGRARLRFRGFPLHQESLLPHHAAQCAGEQGLFWEMHDRLMQEQPRWMEASRPLARFRDYAKGVGVDVGRYNECMEEGRYASRLLATRDEISALGLSATPTFDIGNYRVVGAIPYDSVLALVDLATAARGDP
jgi:protein-disulfide isomerase